MTTAPFAPLHTLASELLPHALEPGEDGAHDLSHLQRVWHNVRMLHAEESGDLEVLLAAVLLHDCVAVEKNSPLRSQASRLAAQKASTVLTALDWPDAKITAVVHAIEAHSFSANITPTTLEARIIQDADRLDSLGMLGVARTFYIAGAWAARCTTQWTRRQTSGTTTTNAFASIISRPSCCTSRTVSKRPPASVWHRFAINA